MGLVPLPNAFETFAQYVPLARMKGAYRMKLKTRIRIALTNIRLYAIVWLTDGLDMATANKFALWDTAQNQMERLAWGRPLTLDAYGRIFGILASRARERADDVIAEQGEGFPLAEVA
jgi:hypothetical protein